MACLSWTHRLLAVVLMCAMHQAAAHGGGLHDWTWSSPGYNYTRILLATTKPFSYYNASMATSYLPGALPFYPSYAPPATVVGAITVWEYLDSTCRETMTLSVDLKFTSPVDNSPLALEKVYIYGFTGNCSTGVQDLYRANITLGDARGNLVWAGREEIFTNVNGSLIGSAPNIFFPRKTATDAGAPLTSILIIPDPQSSPLLCADLVWENYDLPAWTQQVASCTLSPPTTGTRRRRSRRAIA